MKKTVVILLSILLLFISGCGSNSGDASEGTPVPTATPKPETKVVGDTCKSDTWSITLERALITNQIGDDVFMSKASSEKIYVVLFFNVWNNTDSNQYFNHVYFNAFADNERVNMTLIEETEIDGYVMPLGSVKAGSYDDFFVVYELKSNWTKLVVAYDTGIVEPNEHARFVVSPKQCDKIIVTPTPNITATPEFTPTPEPTPSSTEKTSAEPSALPSPT